MAAKKTEKEQKAPVSPADQIEAYAAGVKEFAGARDLLHRGEFAKAKEIFQSLETRHTDEPELAERSRTYARICDRRMQPPSEAPASAADFYFEGVMRSNSGDWDQAIHMFDQAFKGQPSAEILYARACTWALKGSADKAVIDLRDAIAMNPTVRFQAANDPDFEKIREEPTFIDLIEPSTAGV